MTGLDNKTLTMYLNTKSEEENLFVEYEGGRACLYFINGMMSEDGELFTFNQEAKLIYLDGKTVLDNVNKLELDYMLDFYVVLFESERIRIDHYESNKLRNLIKVNDYLYEVPLVDEIFIMNSDLEEMLIYYAYFNEREVDQSELYSNNRKIFKFLMDEKEKVYQDGILNKSEYDDFIDEVNLFMAQYEVQFEQSEGTEMVLSTIYVLRKYLGTEWERVYKLLKM